MLHTTHIVSIMTQIVIVSLSHRAAACRETQIVPLMTQIVQSGVELCAKWCGASKSLASEGPRDVDGGKLRIKKLLVLVERWQLHAAPETQCRSE